MSDSKPRGGGGARMFQLFVVRPLAVVGFVSLTTMGYSIYKIRKFLNTPRTKKPEEQQATPASTLPSEFVVEFDLMRHISNGEFGKVPSSFSPSMSLLELEYTLKTMETDPAVKGLIINNMAAAPGSRSLTRYEELSKSIENLRLSGKKVIGYHDQGPVVPSQYILGAACSKFYVMPGVIYPYGFAVSPTFAKGLLDQWKVDYISGRGGANKSPSPFELATTPDWLIAEYTSLVSSWNAFASENINRLRSIEVNDPNHPPINSLSAIQSKYIDGELLPHQLHKRALQDLNTPTLSIVQLSDYHQQKVRPETPSSASSLKKIALLDLPSLEESATIQSEPFEQQLNMAAKDSRVQALVLRINSPGGLATTSRSLSTLIEDFRKQSNKPVYASIGSTGASGAYMVAANCSQVFANNTSIIGSIGVKFGFMNFATFLSEHGVKTNLIGNQNATFISAPSMALPSPTEMATFNETTRIEHEYFRKLVQNGRKLSELQIDSLTQGQVWTGRQAKQNGLVDEIGTFVDVIQKISPDQPVTLVTYKEGDIWNMLFVGLKSLLKSGSISTDPLPIIKPAMQEKRLFYYVPKNNDNNNKKSVM